MSINRYRLKHLVQTGHRSARLVESLLKKTDYLLSVILLGNTFAAVAIATVSDDLLLEIFGDIHGMLFISTTIVTCIILIFGEITPKIIAVANAEKMAFAYSYVLYPLIKILSPFIWFVNLLVKFLIRLLGMKVNFSEITHAISVDELRSIITDSGNFLPSKNRSILLNLLELDRISIDDIMVPHIQIEMLDISASMEEITSQILHTPYTRLPIKRGNDEEIVGILHLRHITHELQDGSLTKKILEEKMQAPYFVPAGTSLLHQVGQFQKKYQKMALIVDEYGVLKGLITLENIMEELMGEFITTHLNTTRYHQDKSGAYLLDGSANLRELNKKMGFHLPTDGPHTINGLILERLEDIPEIGTSIKIDNYVFEIVQTQDMFVKTIKMTIHPNGDS